MMFVQRFLWTNWEDESIRIVPSSSNRKIKIQVLSIQGSPPPSSGAKRKSGKNIRRPAWVGNEILAILKHEKPTEVEARTGNLGIIQRHCLCGPCNSLLKHMSSVVHVETNMLCWFGWMHLSSIQQLLDGRGTTAALSLSVVSASTREMPTQQLNKKYWRLSLENITFPL